MSIDSTVRQPRVIVLCFDGTSNQYDAAVSLDTGHLSASRKLV